MVVSRIRFPLVLLWLLFTGKALAVSDNFALKAEYMVNLARYSDEAWFNPSKESMYRICSTDRQFVSVANNVLVDARVNGRPVVAVYIYGPKKGCHTLYLSSRNKDAALIYFREFEKSMLVGERKGFIQEGGHVSFFESKDKLRFEISRENLKGSGITLSSKVLRMGRRNGAVNNADD